MFAVSMQHAQTSIGRQNQPVKRYLKAFPLSPLESPLTFAVLLSSMNMFEHSDCILAYLSSTDGFEHLQCVLALLNLREIASEPCSNILRS